VTVYLTNVADFMLINLIVEIVLYSFNTFDENLIAFFLLSSVYSEVLAHNS